MSERLVVKIEGDASGLTKALQSTETRLNSLNTRISNTSRNLTNMQKRMQSFSASVQSAADANNRMAANLNQIITRMNSLSASNTRAANSMKNTTRHANGLTQSLWEMTRKIAIINTLFFTGSGVFGGMIASLIGANSQMEKMNVLLKNMSTAGTEAGKALEAKSNIKYLWDLADKAPFQIEALTKSFVKLKATGIDPTQGTMQALVDTVAYFGGSTDEMNRAGVALSQMLSKGKVTAEELRQQLGDAIPNAMKDMAEALNMSVPELDKKMRDGLVLSADAVPKLMALWQEKYKGGAESMMNTWDGVMARMKNQWDKMMVRITENSGSNSLFATLKKQAEDFTSFMASADGDQFAKGIQDAITKIIEMLVSATKFIYEFREEIVLAGKVMLAVWASKLIWGGLSFGLGKIGQGIKLVQDITKATSMFRASLVLVGPAATRAAAGMGLFNAATKVSLASIGTLLLRLGAWGLAAGAVVGAIYMTNKALDTSSDKQRELAHATLEAKEAAEAERAAIETLPHATEAERKASLQLIAAKKLEIEERRRNVEMIMKEAKAKLVAANAELAALKNSRGITSYGMGVAGPMAMAVNASSAKRKANDASAEAWAAVEKEGEINKLEYALREAEKKINGPLDVPQVNSPSGNAGASGKADKEAEKRAREIERLRDQWINVALARKQYEYELANGNSEEFNTERETEALKKQAEILIKSKKEGEDAIDREIDARRRARQDLKDNDVMTEIAQSTGEAAEEVAFLTRAMDEGYQSLDATYDRIAQSVRNKYQKALEEANDSNKQHIQELIDQQIKLEQTLAGVSVAADYKEKTRDLEESLMTEDELRETVYQREKSRIMDTIAALTLKGDAEGTGREALLSYLSVLEKVNKIKASPFARWAMDARDLNKNIGDSLVGSMDSFIDSLAEGKMNFKDFAVSLIKDLTKIIIKALIAKAILGALGLSGGGSYSGEEISSGLARGITLPDYMQIPVAANHTGGIAGKEATFHRSVDARMFKFAKRYHTGGFPGLKPNEVPIIAEKGEGVFTQEQMRALGGMKSGGEIKAPETTVNIINQSGHQFDAESQTPRFNGEQMVIDVILKNLNRPGPLRDSMKGMK